MLAPERVCAQSSQRSLDVNRRGVASPPPAPPVSVPEEDGGGAPAAAPPSTPLSAGAAPAVASPWTAGVAAVGGVAALAGWLRVERLSIEKRFYVWEGGGAHAALDLEDYRGAGIVGQGCPTVAL